MSRIRFKGPGRIESNLSPLRDSPRNGSSLIASPLHVKDLAKQRPRAYFIVISLGCPNGLRGRKINPSNLNRVIPAEESEIVDGTSTNTRSELPREAAHLLDGLRKARPRVHAITNAAAQVFTANLLLAAGAIPSLTHAVDEAAAFAASADALLINLGTLDPERRAAIPAAFSAARAAGRPVVVDPVFVERSAPRLAFAREIMALRPDILRVNAAEFTALSGHVLSRETCRAYATETGATLAVTGETDFVTDGRALFGIDNGDPLMTRVTAMGCASTALVAAFAALTQDHVSAAASALLVTGVAGEIAARKAGGPGTFQPLFLDALHALDETTLLNGARLS